MAVKNFTPKEDAYLRKNKGGCVNDIALVLGRSESGVRNRMTKLGLRCHTRKPREPGPLKPQASLLNHLLMQKWNTTLEITITLGE